MTLLAPHTEELRKLSELPTELALRRAAAFLARLVKDPEFVESQILPLLEEARDREEWTGETTTPATTASATDERTEERSPKR
jgi:hypothetical protein